MIRHILWDKNRHPPSCARGKPGERGRLYQAVKAVEMAARVVGDGDTPIAQLTSSVNILTDKVHAYMMERPSDRRVQFNIPKPWDNIQRTRTGDQYQRRAVWSGNGEYQRNSYGGSHDSGNNVSNGQSNRNQRYGGDMNGRPLSDNVPSNCFNCGMYGLRASDCRQIRLPDNNEREVRNLQLARPARGPSGQNLLSVIDKQVSKEIERRVLNGPCFIYVVNSPIQMADQFINIIVKGERMECVVDTGAQISCIGADVVERLNLTLLPLGGSDVPYVHGVSSSQLNIVGKVNLRV